MSKVRIALGVSLDGFSAGTDQSLNDPLGKRGPELFQWFFHTKTFGDMHGRGSGSVDLDDEFARRSMENFGAFIIGRNMFGPVRGPWPDNSWKGWWGDNPPYHAPTFVLTHYEREPLVMEGGTTFHFVTGGIHQARGLDSPCVFARPPRPGRIAVPRTGSACAWLFCNRPQNLRARDPFCA